MFKHVLILSVLAISLWVNISSAEESFIFSESTVIVEGGKKSFELQSKPKTKKDKSGNETQTEIGRWFDSLSEDQRDQFLEVRNSLISEFLNEKLETTEETNLVSRIEYFQNKKDQKLQNEITEIEDRLWQFSYSLRQMSATDLEGAVQGPFEAPKILFSGSEVLAPSGNRYRLQQEPQDPKLKELFNTLTPEERANYFESRNSILRPLLESLDRPSKVNFLGWYVSKKDSFVRVSGNFVRRLKKSILGKSEALVMPPEEEPDRIEIGKVQIQELVTQIENELWPTPNVVANRNVSGKSFAINFSIGAGLVKKGRMLNGSIGGGFYVNRDTNRRYFELFLQREEFERAYTYSIPVHVSLKIRWLDWRAEKEETNRITTKGTTMYLPFMGPNVLRDSSGLALAHGPLGLDLFDLIIPLQTLAQWYSTSWTQKRFRYYYSPKMSRACKAFYRKI